MSLLPGGKLRSYHNGQVIFAKDWENEFKNLMRAYNVGQANWFGTNFFPGAPDVCAPGDQTHLFPGDSTSADTSFLYKLEGMYVTFATAGDSCDVYTMKVNGVAVADLLVPDGVPPDDRTIDANNQIGSVRVCDGDCCTTFVTDDDVQTAFIWNTPLDPGDVPQVGDEVTFTLGGSFDTATCPGCSSRYAVYINGIPSGLSVCIPPNSVAGDVFGSNLEIPIDSNDQVTVVPEKVGPHNDVTTQIFGCRAGAGLVSGTVAAVKTRFYVDTGDYLVKTSCSTPTFVLVHGIASPLPLSGITVPQLMFQQVYTFPSDAQVVGHVDNSFELHFQFAKIGIVSDDISTGGSIDNAAIKCDLYLVDSTAVDKFNPTAGEIIAKLIDRSTLDSATPWASGVTVSGSPSIFSARVVNATAGPTISQTAVSAGDFMLLRLYATVTHAGVPGASQLYTFLGAGGAVENSTTGTNVLVANGGGDFDDGTQVQSWIEVGIIE